MARALDRGARGWKRGGLYRPGGGSRARFWGPTCMKEARFGRDKKWPLDDIFLEKNFFFGYFQKYVVKRPLFFAPETGLFHAGWAPSPGPSTSPWPIQPPRLRSSVPRS